MAPKLWRESYSAKGMHALIDYHRSDILPSNVERLWHKPSFATHVVLYKCWYVYGILCVILCSPVLLVCTYDVF